MLKKSLLMLGSLFFSSSLMAADFMGAVWAQQACAAWNKSKTLTEQLMSIDGEDSGFSWIKNDAGRGYKLIQIYRTNCGETTKIQLNIAAKNGKAMCIYGGKPDGKQMNYAVDYVMHANDKNWTCMGSGRCGVMGSMITGKLKFRGPKMEAMQVMSPFAAFLRLTGQVPGTKGACKK